jgi:hypothetical protein
MVMAERLNDQELSYYLSAGGSRWINEPDGEGCTPLYHVIKHQYTKVGLVRLFLEHGARLDIQDQYYEDPYKFGAFQFDEDFEGDKRKLGCSNRKQVLHFVHSEMLTSKLLEPIKKECVIEYEAVHRAKKSTFY